MYKNLPTMQISEILFSEVHPSPFTRAAHTEEFFDVLFNYFYLTFYLIIFIRSKTSFGLI